MFEASLLVCQVNLVIWLLPLFGTERFTTNQSWLGHQRKLSNILETAKGVYPFSGLVLSHVSLFLGKGCSSGAPRRKDLLFWHKHSFGPRD